MQKSNSYFDYLTKRQAAAKKAKKNGRAKVDGYVVIPDGRLHHRAVWEKHNGKLPKGWVVHHINENRSDNRIENLIAMPSHLHDTMHLIQRQRGIRFTKEVLEKVISALPEVNSDFARQRAEAIKLIGELERRKMNAEAAVLVHFANTTSLEPPQEIVKPKKQFTPGVLRRQKSVEVSV